MLAIGAAVGFLGGLFGKGGSAVATPLLHAAGVPPIVAVAAPLPATVPSTLVASWAYWRQQLLDYQVVVWSIALGAPATVAGLRVNTWTSLLAVAAFLAITGLRKQPGDNDDPYTQPEHEANRRPSSNRRDRHQTGSTRDVPTRPSGGLTAQLALGPCR